MANWEIKTTDKDTEDNEYPEDSDEIELEKLEIGEPEFFEEESVSEEESEPLEDILQGVPSKPGFRFNKQGASPSLEQEPVENLEQDLRQVPAQTKDNEKDKALEQPILYNAPQYSGNYEKGDYESMRNVDKELDVSGGALVTREREVIPEFQRRMDFNAWQQQNMERFDTQSEKYQVGKPEKFEQQDNLPFQDTKKSRRF